MVVPADGKFVWHTNPSSQPRLNGETAWRLTCEDGAGNVLEERDVYVARAQVVELAMRCGVGGSPTDPLPVEAACTAPNGFRSVNTTRRKQGAAAGLQPHSRGIRSASTSSRRRKGRRIFKGAKRVALFRNRTRSFNWSGRGTKGKRLSNGVYYVRFRVKDDARARSTAAASWCSARTAASPSAGRST